MPDEKKLCPLQKTTKKQYSVNGNVEYEYIGTCTGERCAWWVINRCAIPQIAINGMERIMNVKTGLEHWGG